MASAGRDGSNERLGTTGRVGTDAGEDDAPGTPAAGAYGWGATFGKLVPPSVGNGTRNRGVTWAGSAVAGRSVAWGSRADRSGAAGAGTARSTIGLTSGAVGCEASRSVAGHGADDRTGKGGTRLAGAGVSVAGAGGCAVAGACGGVTGRGVAGSAGHEVGGVAEAGATDPDGEAPPGMAVDAQVGRAGPGAGDAGRAYGDGDGDGDGAYGEGLGAGDVGVGDVRVGAYGATLGRSATGASTADGGGTTVRSTGGVIRRGAPIRSASEMRCSSSARPSPMWRSASSASPRRCRRLAAVSQSGEAARDGRSWLRAGGGTEPEPAESRRPIGHHERRRGADACSSTGSGSGSAVAGGVGVGRRSSRAGSRGRSSAGGALEVGAL